MENTVFISQAEILYPFAKCWVAIIRFLQPEWRGGDLNGWQLLNMLLLTVEFELKSCRKTCLKTTAVTKANDSNPCITISLKNKCKRSSQKYNYACGDLHKVVLAISLKNVPEIHRASKSNGCPSLLSKGFTNFSLARTPCKANFTHEINITLQKV
jgi:hypothetical protein